jgi:hypothetical protein
MTRRMLTESDVVSAFFLATLNEYEILTVNVNVYEYA